MRRTWTILAVSALWVTAAAAEEAMVTASAGDAPPHAEEGTAAQIDSWIAGSLAAAQEEERLQPPRRVHGEVAVGVGTGGYRHAHVVTHMPIGERGQVTVALSKTEYGRGRFAPPPPLAEFR